MMKNKILKAGIGVMILFLLGLSGCSRKQQGEKIDVVPEPLSVQAEPELKKSDLPVDFTDKKDIGILFHNMYSMKMKQTSYPAHYLQDFEAVLSNHSGPEATAGLQFQMEYMKPPSWMHLPFIDNLAFASIGFPLNTGDTLDFVIHRNLFKNRFEPGRYRATTDVLVELITEFDVVDGAVTVKRKSSDPHAKPFEMTVSSVSLQKKNDSIVFTIRNHSDLPICLSTYPALLEKKDDDRYLQIDHPFFQGATAPVALVIQRLTRMEGGTSMSFSIPVHWNSDSVDPRKKELLPGHYFCRQLIRVELSAEFSYGK